MAWIGGVLFLVAMLLAQIFVFLLYAAVYAALPVTFYNEYPVDFGD